MEIFLSVVKAFAVGGFFCAVGQILIDRTRLTPAKILVVFLIIGLILGGFGIYQKLIDFAGCGATVPICGFGNLVAEGVKKAVDEEGLSGILKGGVTAASAGITAAVFFGFIFALLSKPRRK